MCSSRFFMPRSSVFYGPTGIGFAMAPAVPAPDIIRNGKEHRK
jgi:hypothetical protein